MRTQADSQSKIKLQGGPHNSSWAPPACCCSAQTSKFTFENVDKFFAWNSLTQLKLNKSPNNNILLIWFVERLGAPKQPQDGGLRNRIRLATDAEEKAAMNVLIFQSQTVFPASHLSFQTSAVLLQNKMRKPHTNWIARHKPSSKAQCSLQACTRLQFDV